MMAVPGMQHLEMAKFNKWVDSKCIQFEIHNFWFLIGDILRGWGYFIRFSRRGFVTFISDNFIAWKFDFDSSIYGLLRKLPTDCSSYGFLV